MTISRDGKPAGSERVELRRGENPYLFSLQAPDGGRLRRLLGEGRSERRPGARGTTSSAPRCGSSSAPQRARRRRGRLAGRGDAGSGRDRGRERRPGSLPSTAAGYAGVDAVVLEDVSAGELGDERAAALADAVRGEALGLLVLGGQHSFSLGRYYRLAAGSRTAGPQPRCRAN